MSGCDQSPWRRLSGFIYSREVVPRIRAESLARVPARQKRFNQLAAKLEKALLKEKRLQERIEKVRAESAEVSRLFELSGRKPATRAERRKTPRA